MECMGPKSIVIVAGEASGDLHASHVVHALRKRHQDLFICGVGGRAMQAAGAKVLIPADRLAVVGITEVLAKAPVLLKAMGRCKRLLAGLKPDLLMLIDFPDFNLHLAMAAKKLGIPVLYYISPQIWAWRSQRVKKIRKRVDHMAVILPFESAFYERHGVPVSFVGHPLLDIPNELPQTKKTWPIGEPPMIGLLPGSRDREVTRLLPTMLEAARILKSKIGPIRLAVSQAPSIDPSLIRQILTQSDLPDIQVVNDPVGALFKQCHLTVVASGTVTLEAALYETPMIITYAVSPLSYGLGRMLVNVPHIGLVNLIAQQRVVPELVQKAVTAQSIADAAYPLLTDRAAYDRVCTDLQEVKKRLGQAGASQRVADIACTLMGCRHAL